MTDGTARGLGVRERKEGRGKGGIKSANNTSSNSEKSEKTHSWRGEGVSGEGRCSQ